MDMESSNEEVSRHCAFCLVPLSAKNVKNCGRCKRRAYCSRECQTEDWSAGKNGQVHKIWCKLGCGEEDLDWEVGPIEGKGLGIIAKRLIPARYQIMVDAVRSERHPGLQDLMPLNGTTREKIALNGLDDGKGRTVICLRLSRANHDCSSNADHYYDTFFKVKVMFALRDIQKGEEICINYQPMNDVSNSTTGERARSTLENTWGIICKDTCFCRNEEIEKLVQKGRKLDQSIIDRASIGRVADALESLDNLLLLHESIKSSYISKMRTLYDGFQVSIMQKRSLRKAEGYIKQAYEIVATVLGSPKSELALEYKELLLDPSSHSNYLTR